MRVLKVDSDGPNVLRLQRRLLTNRFAFVPGFPVVFGFHNWKTVICSSVNRCFMPHSGVVDHPLPFASSPGRLNCRVQFTATLQASGSPRGAIWVGLTHYLETRLKLKVNPVKSKVVPMSDCRYLGFTLRGTKIRWSDKALANFKHRVRELTGRSWGISMTIRLNKLGNFLRGWFGYFGISM